MKSRLTSAGDVRLRSALAGGAVLLVGVAALAALAPEPWGELLKASLAPLCHQIPERSFVLDGVSMGLCHRCAALLLGLAIMLVPPGGLLRSVSPRLLIAIAMLPVAADWGLDAAGLWENTMASRVATGAWAGGMLAIVIGLATGSGIQGSGPERAGIALD